MPLFDILIKPVIDIIASGSQIWNFAITDSNNLFGIIHLKCCKFTLGYVMMLLIWQLMVSLNTLLSQYAENLVRFKW